MCSLKDICTYYHEEHPVLDTLLQEPHWLILCQCNFYLKDNVASLGEEVEQLTCINLPCGDQKEKKQISPKTSHCSSAHSNTTCIQLRATSGCLCRRLSSQCSAGSQCPVHHWASTCFAGFGLQPLKYVPVLVGRTQRGETPPTDHLPTYTYYCSVSTEYEHRGELS